MSCSMPTMPTLAGESSKEKGALDPTLRPTVVVRESLKHAGSCFRLTRLAKWMHTKAGLGGARPGVTPGLFYPAGARHFAGGSGTLAKAPLSPVQ